MSKSLILVLALSAVLLSAAAQAEDPYALPPICTQGAMDSGMGAMDHSGHVDQAHRDLMAGMGEMHAQMMIGMQAADIDVAFVCGMIPHHQGAIDMARAELAHGDDPWVRALAEQIIAAQEKEIADMKAWLEKQPQ